MDKKTYLRPFECSIYRSKKNMENQCKEKVEIFQVEKRKMSVVKLLTGKVVHTHLLDDKKNENGNDGQFKHKIKNMNIILMPSCLKVLSVLTTLDWVVVHFLSVSASTVNKTDKLIKTTGKQE